MSSFRLSESFLRNVRLKIPSTLISQAQGLANKLHEVPIKVNYKNDTNMAPAAVVALHGLQAGCITAAIELAAPTNDTQPATGDGMELTGKADDEDPTMTSTSSKAYLASGDLDSLTAKGACSMCSCNHPGPCGVVTKPLTFVAPSRLPPSSWILCLIWVRIVHRHPPVLCRATAVGHAVFGGRFLRCRG